MSPPTSAPCTESRPPRITAGNARKATNTVSWSTEPVCFTGGCTAKMLPRVASAAPAAQAMAKTRPMLMPWAIAASWSWETARIAIPIRER